MFDRNIAVNNTFSVTGSSHTGLENPADPNSRALESVFEISPAYKNRNGGIWGRGEMHVFRNVKLADNAMGFTHASGAFGRYAFTSQVVDSLFVGETENIGNPTTDAEKAYGRSLPKRDLPDFPIRGYEYYDYRHDVVNTTFRNYEDNATRKTGAISNLLFSSFGRQHQQRLRAREIRQRQAGVFPADGEQQQVGQRQWRQYRRIRPRRFATRTARSAVVPIPTCSSTTASTTASQSTQKPVRSSPPGTLRCARAISDA
jgi:cell migration-inducing and hyaluronan-binding protein